MVRSESAAVSGRLATQIALKIVELIHDQGLMPGAHLRSQELANAFKVSRAPVTAALKLLEESGIVRSERHRGYFVQKTGEASTYAGTSPLNEDDDRVYFQIAEDHLSGQLTSRVSENDLIRRYAVTRMRVQNVLTRASNEGWVERLPGHGWEFLAVLTSSNAYEQAYRFRADIETAALQLDTFSVDERAFRTARVQQISLLDGDIFRLSRAQLFEMNSKFHEMVVECSGNAFYIDALKRVNRLRRLMEYRITLDRTRLIRQCREHLEILDLLEAGRREEAVPFLRAHIETALRLKKAGTL